MELEKGELTLEDGDTFSGISFGANENTDGEVVFNTGMVGYPLSLTDPSYRGQILTLTYPLIGNYGVPSEDKWESREIQVKGVLITDYSFKYSHHSSKKSLMRWLKEENVPALTGIDTRKLTKKLREEGTMLGAINTTKEKKKKDYRKVKDPNQRNLAKEVSIDQVREYGEGKIKIALIDCGVKKSIISSLLNRNVKILHVPWNYDLFKNSEDFDGILISNGPGDPKTLGKTIKITEKAFEAEIPIFGICMGNLIMGLATGAGTYKLKYGHRSQNQPCISGKKCYITSQNHGYAIKKPLPNDWKEWMINANDKTNEGIKHKDKPFMSVQFHPEANPGPLDTKFLFDKFLKEVKLTK